MTRGTIFAMLVLGIAVWVLGMVCLALHDEIGRERARIDRVLRMLSEEGRNDSGDHNDEGDEPSAKPESNTAEFRRHVA